MLKVPLSFTVTEICRNLPRDCAFRCESGACLTRSCDTQPESAGAKDSPVRRLRRRRVGAQTMQILPAQLHGGVNGSKIPPRALMLGFRALLARVVGYANRSPSGP